MTINTSMIHQGNSVDKAVDTSNIQMQMIHDTLVLF